MTCKVCTRIKSHFCFGSDLLQHNKEKHHSDAKSPTKRLLVKQDVEDVDVKLQKLSNSPVEKSTMKQSLDNQKVNDADDHPPNLSSSSIDMPTMKQLLAKHHVNEDLPNLSTIIEIPTCQEPDAVGVEEVDPKLGEEPTLDDTLLSESTLDDTRELRAALSDGVSLSPLLIVESDMFDISVSTFVDHRVFKVDCDRLDIIDDLYANFCSIPERRFVCISDTSPF
jgi:hypothetical protein